IRRRLESGKDVEHRRLAAAGVADDADEFAARHRQPQLLEHRRAAATRRRKALADAFDRDEFIGHGLVSSRAMTAEGCCQPTKLHSGNVTSPVPRPSI